VRREVQGLALDALEQPSRQDDAGAIDAGEPVEADSCAAVLLRSQRDDLATVHARPPHALTYLREEARRRVSIARHDVEVEVGSVHAFGHDHHDERVAPAHEP
jgi:hypothetical protein